MPTYSYAIGTLAGGTAGLTNVETLLASPKGTFPPQGSYSPGTELRLGSLGTRWVGTPQAVWRWGFLSRTQRDALRAFCSGASAEVYITTRVNDLAGETGSETEYRTYRALLLWPAEERREAQGRRVDFELRFNLLEEVTV
jgi:hypothetical protein